MVKKGKELGFLKIHLITWWAHAHLRYALQNNPKSGDVILTTRSSYWCMYEVIDGKAKFLKGNLQRLSDDGINEIKNGHYRNPNIVFNFGNSDLLKKVKGAFPGIKLIDVQQVDYSEVALLKARILSNDAEVLGYDVFPSLGCKLSIKCNGNEIILFKGTEILPVEKITELHCEVGDELTVVSFFKPLNIKINGFHQQEISLTFLFLPQFHIYLPNFR